MHPDPPSAWPPGPDSGHSTGTAPGAGWEQGAGDGGGHCPIQVTCPEPDPPAQRSLPSCALRVLHTLLPPGSGRGLRPCAQGHRPPPVPYHLAHCRRRALGWALGLSRTDRDRQVLAPDGAEFNRRPVLVGYGVMGTPYGGGDGDPRWWGCGAMGTPDGGVWGDGASGHAVGRSADLPLSKQPSVVSQPQPSATQQLRPLLQPRSRPWGGAQSSPRWHHSQRTQTKRPSTGTHEGAPLHEGSTHTRCGALNRNAEDAKGPGEDTSAGNQRLLQQSGRPEEGGGAPSEGSWRLKTGPPHRRGHPTLQHLRGWGFRTERVRRHSL